MAAFVRWYFWGDTRSHSQDADHPETSTVTGLHHLSPLLQDLAHAHILEDILAACDATTLIRLARTSRHLNTSITTSSRIQLALREAHHAFLLPRHSRIRQKSKISKAEELETFIARQQRLTAVKPLGISRKSMDYIDLLDTGDHLFVTRSLRGEEGAGQAEIGRTEDAWTMLCKSKKDLASRPGPSKGGDGVGKENLAWTEWTVDHERPYADIGARPSDDLVVVVTQASHTNADHEDTRKRIIMSFYQLYAYQPDPDKPNRGTPLPHRGARLPSIDIEVDTESSRPLDIRIRTGHNGLIILWVKTSESDNSGTAYAAHVFDWQRGETVGMFWSPKVPGFYCDWAILAPGLLLGVKNELLRRSSSTASTGNAPSKLLFQAFHLTGQGRRPIAQDRPVRLARQGNRGEQYESADFDSNLPFATFEFPEFSNKSIHAHSHGAREVRHGPFTFSLGYCNLAYKEAPLMSSSRSLAKDGLIICTIGGLTGPFTHGGMAPHEHETGLRMIVSVSTLRQLLQQVESLAIGGLIKFEQWEKGITWEFDTHVWMSGHGLRTVQTWRWIESPMELDMDDEEFNLSPDASTPISMSIVVRDFNPTAIAHAGQLILSPLGKIPVDRTVLPRAAHSPPDPPPAYVSTEFAVPINNATEFWDNMQATLTTLQAAGVAHLEGNGPPAPLLATLTQLVVDLEANAGILQGDPPTPASPSTEPVYRIVDSQDNGIRVEIFGTRRLRSYLPYVEVHAQIPLGDQRRGAEREIPFKTIFSGDKLVICDEGGFDLIEF